MAGIIYKENTGNVVVNGETGEVLRAETVVKKKDIEEWGMLFVKSLNFNGVSSAEAKLLVGVWKYSDWNKGDDGNVFQNTKYNRERLVADGFASSERIVRNLIKSLCEKAYLKDFGGNAYQLNPEYFFKGKLTDRANVKFIVEYKPEYSLELGE